MTGIERLRHVAFNWNNESLNEIADQIDREHVSRTRVLSVITEMERHVLGHEGMEDSPVARWARELREALGGEECDPADLLPADEREAIAWVCEHGGLENVRDAWNEAVNLCATIGCEPNDESEMLQALGDCTDIVIKRLMPEGMEWLRFEDGEPVRFGDEFIDHQGSVRSVLNVKMWQEGGFEIGTGQGTYDWHEAGERVKRPAPKVLDADGMDTSVGDTVYDVDTGEKMWVCALPEQGAYQCVKLRLNNGMFKTLDPCRLTHERPDSLDRLAEDIGAMVAAWQSNRYLFDAQEAAAGCVGENTLGAALESLTRRARALAERGQ